MNISPEDFISYHPSWLGAESKMSPLTRKSRPFHCRYGTKSKNSPVTILEGMVPLNVDLVNCYIPRLTLLRHRMSGWHHFWWPKELGNKQRWILRLKWSFVNTTMTMRCEITHRLTFARDLSRHWSLPTTIIIWFRARVGNFRTAPKRFIYLMFWECIIAVCINCHCVDHNGQFRDTPPHYQSSDTKMLLEGCTECNKATDVEWNCDIACPVRS